MEGGVLGLLERGIAPSLLASTDLRRRALLAKGISLMLVLLGSLVGALVFFVAAPELRWLGLINTLATCGLASLSILFLRRGRLVIAGNWIAALIAIGIVYSVFMGGGVRAPFGVLLPVIPVLAMVISGRRSGVFWALFTSLFIVSVEAARLSGVEFENLNPESVDTLTMIGLVGGTALLAWISSFSEDLKERAIEQIQETSAQRDIAVAEETKARKLLAGHRDVEGELHAELDKVLGGRSPTVADLPQLVYTRQVLDETLRLYPPIWVDPRVAIADDVLAGYNLAAGTVMMPMIFATHRHPEFWADPERFDPARFAPELAKARHPMAHVPFGGGPRVCLGMAFAYQEMVLAVATMAQRFRLQRSYGTLLDLDPKAGTLRPLWPALVDVYRRD